MNRLDLAWAPAASAARGWALALATMLAACGSDSHERSEPEESEPPLFAVTSEGEGILFAGPSARERSATRGRRGGYDEDGLIREPNQPDPEDGDFTLEEAVVDLPIEGSLVAEIGTPFGALMCDLYAERVPNAVANFIGLARGLRPWWDARAGEWVRRPYYRGLTFHRVIPEFLIQTGDYLGDGTGTVGYRLPDELDDTLAHDRAGQMVMANLGNEPNSAGGQFFLTDGPAPQLDEGGMYTIFGQCQPEHVISQIARVPQNPDEGHRPLTPIGITRLLIRRVDGGAAAAQATRPRLPPGEPEVPRGASPDPSRGRYREPPIETPYGRPSPLPEREGGGQRRGPLPPPVPPRP
ncbi:MAG: peptidylprolyl isomerase [Sandaracinaceae bacterium]